MEEIGLEVKPREKGKKKELKKLRHQGLVPAVLYGGEQKSSLLSINQKDLEKIIKNHGDNVLLSLQNSPTSGNENSEMAMIKDIQRDPLFKSLLHIDLFKVSLEDQITTRVPVRVVGDELMRKQQGGITDLIIRELEIRCIPTKIPHYITVDVSELDIGDTLHVSDIELEEGIEITIEGDRTLITIVPPSKIEEAVVEVPEEEEAVAAAAEEEGGEAGASAEEGTEADKSAE